MKFGDIFDGILIGALVIAATFAIYQSMELIFG